MELLAPVQAYIQLLALRILRPIDKPCNIQNKGGFYFFNAFRFGFLGQSDIGSTNTTVLHGAIGLGVLKDSYTVGARRYVQADSVRLKNAVTRVPARDQVRRSSHPSRTSARSRGRRGRSIGWPP